MRQIIFYAWLLSIPALAGACGRVPESPPAKSALLPPAGVAPAKVTRAALEDFYEATGTVRAKTTTEVSSNIPGRIVAFAPVEGDTVTRGQVVAEIDDRESLAQLRKAEAGLREAEAALVEIDRAAEAARAGIRTAEADRTLADQTFARIRELHARRSASGQEFDTAQSRVRAAAAQLDRARAEVATILAKKKQIDARIEQARADIANTKIQESYARIVAPVSGVVVKKFAEAGATAAPGRPLLAIEDNSQYRLEAAVEESRAALARVGGRVAVRIDALGGGEFYGTVAEILPAADAASRSLTVKIDLPPNPLLKTGLYGLARFPSAARETLAVAPTAIVERGQLTGVYVVAPDGTAQFRIVTKGRTAEGLVEILAGLSEGDEIVTTDANRLSDGVRIR